MGQEKNRSQTLADGVQLVDTIGKLQGAVAHLKTVEEMAVDVEADSMFHYQEKVCLIQVAASDAVYIIDPLQTPSLDALGPLFRSRKIRKIFHGADYDVRSLYRDFGIDIHNLFDTELAARFLGLPESGLEALLAARFGVQLDKRYQRKDWSKRPLPEAMVTYAAGDVRHLISLASQLESELRKKKRLSWVEEECRHLSRVRPLNNGNQPLFVGIKGAGRLRPRHLAALEMLLKLRQRIAREKDRPLFKVLSSRSLLRIAVALPRSLPELESADVLSKKQIAMYGRELIDAVNAAADLPKSQLPAYPRKATPRLPPAVPRRVQALKAWRDRKAENLKMDPGLLINKHLIQAVAIENPKQVDDLDKIADFRDWRKSAFGNAIVDVLKSNL